MPFEIKMGSDGILRIIFTGDLDNTVLDTLRRELSPFVEASTPSKPLMNLMFFRKFGQLSPSIRHYLSELNQDQRLGKTAFIHPPRKARVLGKFMLNASGRNNIQYFDQEGEAITWLRNQEG